jgi:hypothetical protein
LLAACRIFCALDGLENALSAPAKPPNLSIIRFDSVTELTCVYSRKAINSILQLVAPNTAPDWFSVGMGRPMPGHARAVEGLVEAG